MRFRPSATGAALALGALLPSAATAQSADAFVLPFGMFRLGVEGIHASYDSRFDASGNRVPLGEELSGELVPSRFVALAPLAGHLGSFLEQTAGGPGSSAADLDPQSISLGLLEVAMAESRTQGRARLSVGIVPRIEIGAAVSMVRGDRIVHRLDLSGGNLGINPDTTANRALLGGIGWAPLGASPLLPTAESPLGIELQSRVTALTDQPMALPEDTAGAAVLQTILAEQYGLPPLESGVEQARLGDVELDARALLFSTFGSAPVPVDPAGVNLRVALSGGVRLPVGEQPDSLPLLAPQPDAGISALNAGASGDLFLGSRFWITGAARLTWGRTSEVVRRVAPPTAPLSVIAPTAIVSITPGNTLEIRVEPRFRLIESISIGGSYASLSVEDTEYSGGPEGTDPTVLNLPGGRLQRVGVGIRYSSLPAYWVGRASLPAEVVLAYERTISGVEGAPAGGVLTITASVLPQLWGR